MTEAASILMTGAASIPIIPGLARPARSSFWARIAAELADEVVRGIHAPGARLPSEHALAARFGVNRHTIRRSLASLCGQGLLRATQGSGTYVEEFAVDLALARRTRHHQNIALAGLRGGLRVLTAQTVRAAGPQARALRIHAHMPLLCLGVLGDAKHLPLHVSERFFPLPRFAGLEAVVRETGSITAAFAAHGVNDYTRLESRISAELPDASIAAHLRQPVTRPVLQVESVNVDEAGVPIEYAKAWFAGDRVTLTVTHG